MGDFQCRRCIHCAYELYNISVESKDCFIMRTITRLIFGLLLFKFPIIASYHLNKREEGGVWPEIDFGAAALGGAIGVGGLIDGAVNLFQNSGDSDPPDPTSTPDAGFTSQIESSPLSPQAVPGSPPSDSSSSPEGVYKLEINNGPAPTMTPDTDPSEVAPLENERCDPENVGTHRQINFQREFLEMIDTDTALFF